MDDQDITIYKDVMSLVGNLSLAAAGTMIFLLGIATGDIPLSFLGGLMAGIGAGLLKKRFYGRGW